MKPRSYLPNFLDKIIIKLENNDIEIKIDQLLNIKSINEQLNNNGISASHKLDESLIFRINDYFYISLYCKNFQNRITLHLKSKQINKYKNDILVKYVNSDALINIEDFINIHNMTYESVYDTEVQSVATQLINDKGLKVAIHKANNLSDETVPDIDLYIRAIYITSDHLMYNKTSYQNSIVNSIIT